MTLKITLKVLVLFVIISFSSCAMFDPIAKVNLNSLKLGMTKEEVRATIKKRPDNIIAAKRDAETDNLIEVVQYTQEVDPVGTYWLYFENNKLTKWEKATKWRQPEI